jgi:hypothetical protein
VKFTTFGAARILGVTPQQVRRLVEGLVLHPYDTTDSGMLLFTEPELLKVAVERERRRARDRHAALRTIRIRMARAALRAGQLTLPFRETKASTRRCDRNMHRTKHLRFLRKVS